jgi:hypothetical protein
LVLGGATQLSLVVGGCVLLFKLVDIMWAGSAVTYNTLLTYAAVVTGALGFGLLLNMGLDRHRKKTAAAVAAAGGVPASQASDREGEDDGLLASAQGAGWSAKVMALVLHVFTDTHMQRLRVATLFGAGALYLARYAQQHGTGSPDNVADDAHVQAAVAMILLVFAGLLLVTIVFHAVVSVLGLTLMGVFNLLRCAAMPTRFALPAVLGGSIARAVFQAGVVMAAAGVLTLTHLSAWGDLHGKIHEGGTSMALLACLTAGVWLLVALGLASGSKAAEKSKDGAAAVQPGAHEAVDLALILTFITIQASRTSRTEAATGSLRITVLTALVAVAASFLLLSVLFGPKGVLAASMNAVVARVKTGKGGAVVVDDKPATRTSRLQAFTFMAGFAVSVASLVLGFMGTPGLVQLHNVHAPSGIVFACLLALALAAMAVNLYILAAAPSPDIAAHNKLHCVSGILFFSVVTTWVVLWHTDGTMGKVVAHVLLIAAGAKGLSTFPWRGTQPGAVSTQ